MLQADNPVLAWNFPAAQAVQLEANWSEYEPIAQLKQLADPDKDVYLPDAHEEHSLAPDAAYFAVVQLTQKDLPTADWKNPAEHEVHADKDGIGAKKPALQGAHAEEPTAAAVDPTRQSAQLDAPEVAAIFPSAHCRQDAAPVDPWYQPDAQIEHIVVELDAEY